MGPPLPFLPCLVALRSRSNDQAVLLVEAEWGKALTSFGNASLRRICRVWVRVG